VNHLNSGHIVTRYVRLFWANGLILILEMSRVVTGFIVMSLY